MLVLVVVSRLSPLAQLALVPALVPVLLLAPQVVPVLAPEVVSRLSPLAVEAPLFRPSGPA